MESTDQPMDLTDVTGPFGYFQKRILFVLLLRPICWCMLMINYQFINQKVSFQCAQPEVTIQEDQVVLYNLTTSTGQCHRRPYTGEKSSDGGLWDSNDTVQCDTFIYTNNKTYTTITEEWNLVCSKEWLIPLGYMVFSIGNFLAYLPTGQLADKFGRRPLILAGQGLMTLISLIIAFSNSMVMFLVLRFFVGFGFGFVQNPFMAVYVESVGPEYRDYIVYSFAAAWGFGTMAVAFLAWFIQDWRTLVLVCSIPFQLPLLLSMWWWVPESTRWLLSTKQYEKAEKQLLQQAKMNGVEVTDSKKVMERLKEKIDQDAKSDTASFVDLLRNKHLRKVTLILYISFVSTVFINHGFTLTIGLEGGSIYLNIFLAGLAEVPVVFFYYLTVKYFNRRKGLLISFILTGIIFLAVIPVSNDIQWVKLTLAMVGRMTNTLAYTLIYVFANELFPTNLRAVAVSGAMTSGRIGSILCPFADVLGRFYGKNYPIILYGCLSLATSAVFLLLPETQHKQLPDTVVDFEILATQQRTNLPLSTISSKTADKKDSDKS